jgi:hypothetical protein
MEKFEEVLENLVFGEKRSAAKGRNSDAQKLRRATSVIVKGPSLLLPKPSLLRRYLVATLRAGLKNPYLSFRLVCPKYPAARSRL